MKLNRVITFGSSLLIASATIGQTAWALPGVSFGVMGGVAVSSPSHSKDTAGALSGAMGLSGGASLGISNLEVSALYTQYKQETKLGTSTLSDSANYLDIPVLYRLELGPLSVGAGGFYGLAMTKDAAKTAEDNYGATASVRFTIPVIGIFADARYNLGLKESAVGSKMSSAAAYIGINFL